METENKIIETKEVPPSPSSSSTTTPPPPPQPQPQPPLATPPQSQPSQTTDNKDNVVVPSIVKLPKPLSVPPLTSITDNLICKTPHDGKSTPTVVSFLKNNNDNNKIIKNDSTLYLGVLQLFFGFMMVVFGISVIINQASLAYIGGGIWGGILSMSTGISGLLVGANNWCPLKITAQHIIHTIFLALSLISLAVAQLIAAIAATGLGRDLNYSNDNIDKTMHNAALLSNIGLLVVSGMECLLAALSSYRSARLLCPCFQQEGDDYYEEFNRHALVRSWLGDNNPPPQLYVITTNGVPSQPPTSSSTLGKGSKISSGLPVIAFTPPTQQSAVITSYPLIPAPLGQIPSPIIPPPPRHDKWSKRQRRPSKPITNQHCCKSVPPPPPPSSSSSLLHQHHHKVLSKDKQISDQDIVRSYTGLDKTIAEEFIDICDSRNSSLCSDSSCTRSSCQSPTTTTMILHNNNCNGSETTTSREYLINKI